MRTCLICGSDLPQQNKKLCSKECFRIYLKLIRTGSGNPMWKGSSVTIDAARARARRRKNESCECCGDLKSEVHHRDGNPRNNAPSNLESLCRSCHMEKDGRTQALISRSAEIKRAQTHCHRGHLFDEENTYIEKKGTRRMRHCRKCHALREANRRERLRGHEHRIAA